MKKVHRRSIMPNLWILIIVILVPLFLIGCGLLPTPVPPTPTVTQTETSTPTPQPTATETPTPAPTATEVSGSQVQGNFAPLTIFDVKLQITDVAEQDLFGDYGPRDTFNDTLFVINAQVLSTIDSDAYGAIDWLGSLSLSDENGRTSHMGTISYTSTSTGGVSKTSFVFVVSKASKKFTLTWPDGHLDIPLP